MRNLERFVRATSSLIKASLTSADWRVTPPPPSVHWATSIKKPHSCRRSGQQITWLRVHLEFFALASIVTRSLHFWHRRNVYRLLLRLFFFISETRLLFDWFRMGSLKKGWLRNVAFPPEVYLALFIFQTIWILPPENVSSSRVEIWSRCMDAYMHCK